MSANKIVSSQLIKTIKNSGKNIKLKYATKTEAWDRTYLAQSVQEDFGKAVEKADVPAGATTAILARVISFNILNLGCQVLRWRIVKKSIQAQVIARIILQTSMRMTAATTSQPSMSTLESKVGACKVVEWYEKPVNVDAASPSRMSRMLEVLSTQFQ